MHGIRAGLYKHYKGGTYLVLGVSEHTETGEILVNYVVMNPDLPGYRLRSRPLEGKGGWNTPVEGGTLTTPAGVGSLCTASGQPLSTK